MVIGVVAGGVAFLVAGAFVPLLVRFAVGRNLLDLPNLRSSHDVPTPRLGGVAIFLGMLAGVTILGPVGLWPLLAAAAVVSADDPLGRSWVARRSGSRCRGVLARGPKQRLQLHGWHRRHYGGRRARQRALPRAARGTGGRFPARAHRGYCGVPDLEHKPCIHLSWGLWSILNRLQPCRCSPLRSRALGAGVDAFGLFGLRGRLHALPLRHRIYAGSAGSGG